MIRSRAEHLQEKHSIYNVSEQARIQALGSLGAIHSRLKEQSLPQPSK